jgi:hypothetical protein
VEKAGRQLLERLDARIAPGHPRQPRHGACSSATAPRCFIPIHGTDEIADVTGAGDTVIARFSSC